MTTHDPFDLLPAGSKPRLVVQNGSVFATSLAVAEQFEKLHRDVLRAIRNLKIPENTVSLYFAQTVYYRTNPSGGEPIPTPYFNLTRDGFTLLVMGFTGEKAFQWKLKYIQAFNAMEAALREQDYRNRYQAEIQNIQREALNEAALAMAQLREQDREELLAEAHRMTKGQIAHQLRIPSYASEAGGYMSEHFMLLYFGLERRFADAALVWILYDRFIAQDEPAELNAQQLSLASGGAFSRQYVPFIRKRLLDKRILNPSLDNNTWSLNRVALSKLLLDTHLVEHPTRIPRIADEDWDNQRINEWLVKMTHKYQLGLPSKGSNHE